MNIWEQSRLAARCEDALGLTVRQVFDPDEMKQVLGVMDKGYLSPLLDPEKNDFTPASGFWLVAERAGEPQMAGGVRFDDLRGMDVSEFWSRMLRRAFTDAPDVSQGDFPSGVVAGRTAYFGDLLSRGRVGLGAEGALRLRLFTGIGHYLTHQEFNPDVVYCFVTDRDAMRGAPAAYGFLELVPFLYDWAVAPYPGGRSPEWVACTRREQFGSLLGSLERLTGELARKRSECSLGLGDLSPS
jgi:hypothetical protein